MAFIIDCPITDDARAAAQPGDAARCMIVNAIYEAYPHLQRVEVHWDRRQLWITDPLALNSYGEYGVRLWYELPDYLCELAKAFDRGETPSELPRIRIDSMDLLRKAPMRRRSASERTAKRESKARLVEQKQEFAERTPREPRWKRGAAA